MIGKKIGMLKGFDPETNEWLLGLVCDESFLDEFRFKTETERDTKAEEIESDPVLFFENYIGNLDDMVAVSVEADDSPEEILNRAMFAIVMGPMFTEYVGKELDANVIKDIGTYCGKVLDAIGNRTFPIIQEVSRDILSGRRQSNNKLTQPRLVDDIVRTTDKTAWPMSPEEVQVFLADLRFRLDYPLDIMTQIQVGTGTLVDSMLPEEIMALACWMNDKDKTKTAGPDMIGGPKIP